ncbi:TonB-dependent receptor plug domain-containing protein [Fibrobacterota bacterium]
MSQSKTAFALGLFLALNLFARDTTGQISPDTTGIDGEYLELEELVVTPGSYSLMGKNTGSRQTLSGEDIKNMGWAEDVTRAIQRVPGISGNDFTAKFNIRGGEADEVLFLIDGMQIYKPYHQKDFGGGIFSTVDIETVDRLDLLTGGYSAEYGDRASGVLSLKTRAAKGKKREHSLGLSLINVRGLSLGTFNRERTSWLVSGRRGYLDLLNRLMEDEFKLRPTYYDALAKVEHQLNDNQRLAGYVFFASDDYLLDEKENEPGKTVPNIDYSKTDYKNSYAWTALHSDFSPDVYARSLLYGAYLTQNRYWDRFDDDPNFHLTIAELNDDRDRTLVGVKQDWNWDITRNLLLKWGGEMKYNQTYFTYNSDITMEFILQDNTLIERIESADIDHYEEGFQGGAYLSPRIRVFKTFTIEPGLRYDYISHTGDELWSPRVSALYFLTPSTSLRAGWGHYSQSQEIDDLKIQFGELSYHSAVRSEHFVAGLERHFKKIGLHLRTETYYKRITDVPDYWHTFANIDEFYPEARDDRIKVEVDNAEARGIEFLLKHKAAKKLTWWVSYVLSEAEENVRDVKYDGRLVKTTGWKPRAWDQRHSLSIDANYKLSKKWYFNLAWQYRSGWPYTEYTVERIQRPDNTFAYYHDYGEFNAGRYPAYHRLDVRINRHFHTRKGIISAFLHVINLYNRENVYAYDHEVVSESATDFRALIEPEPFFGILPFAGVNWEF